MEPSDAVGDSVGDGIGNTLGDTDGNAVVDVAGEDEGELL
jgi:hypothetical protein